MAIRLRKTPDGDYVALCAAEHIKLPGDTYLHDGFHHALYVKFAADRVLEDGGGAAQVTPREDDRTGNPVQEDDGWQTHDEQEGGERRKVPSVEAQSEAAQPAEDWETDRMKAERRRVETWLWDVGHGEDKDAAHLAALAQTVIAAHQVHMQNMTAHLQAFHPVGGGTVEELKREVEEVCDYHEAGWGPTAAFNKLMISLRTALNRLSADPTEKQ